jgi:tetratricopeptide (TPR) repeat protein
MRALVAGLVILSAASTARAAGENMEEAKQHFAKGVEAYDQGKYETALREFGQAHARSHSPALYFNMAACEEHMDHFQAAALLLNQYLVEKPDADDRDNVKLRIQSLQERDERLHKMTEPVPPVKPVPLTAEPTAEPPKRHLKYTWVMLGVTAGVGAAAIGVGAYTVAHHSDLKNGCGNTIDGCSPGQISTLKSTAVATDVLIGVTAAAAVATVVFAVLETKKSHAKAERGTHVAFIGNGVAF